jgi:TRAP-type transport system periplasmic protein
MNKVVLHWAGGLLLAAAVSTGAAAYAESLNYGSHMPPTNPLLVGGIDVVNAKVKEATNGELEFVSHPGGSIVDGKTALQGIGTGLIESGLVMDVYDPSALRYSTFITALGMVDAGTLSGAAAVTELQLLECEGCQQDFEAANVVSLALLRLRSPSLFCREGIETYADLAGKKISAESFTALFVAKVGAVPTSVPVADQYEALQRGLIDCAIGPDYFLSVYNLWDTAKVVFDMPIGAFQGVHAMTINRDVWDGLSTENRAAILAAMPDMMTGVSGGLEELGANARTEGEKSHGLKFIQADDKFTAALEAVGIESKEIALKNAHQAGLKDPEALAVKLDELVEKWNRIVEQAGEDQEAVKAAIREQIYAKIASN